MGGGGGGGVCRGSGTTRVRTKNESLTIHLPEFVPNFVFTLATAHGDSQLNLLQSPLPVSCKVRKNQNQYILTVKGNQSHGLRLPPHPFAFSNRYKVLVSLQHSFKAEHNMHTYRMDLLWLTAAAGDLLGPWGLLFLYHRVTESDHFRRRARSRRRMARRRRHHQRRRGLTKHSVCHGIRVIGEHRRLVETSHARRRRQIRVACEGRRLGIVPIGNSLPVVGFWFLFPEVLIHPFGPSHSKKLHNPTIAKRNSLFFRSCTISSPTHTSTSLSDEERQRAPTHTH